MIARTRREHPRQEGIDTVTFSSYGSYIGRLSADNFARDWATKVRLGGGTQVMQGWQTVKKQYFEYQNANYGHGRYDQVYGWQPTPGMPKLSLLVFLDGEAQDMDEFELELMGETWAYVTIALVGECLPYLGCRIADGTDRHGELPAPPQPCHRARESGLVQSSRCAEPQAI